MPLFPGDGFNVPTLIKTTLDSSDYVLIVNNTGILCQISKADLVASLASSDTGGAIGGVAKIYATDGDDNGVFHYIGTNQGTTSWANPTTRGLIVTASSIQGISTGAATTEDITNRADSDFNTYNFPNNWVSFYLGDSKSLKCNHYTIKTRSSLNNFYPRNWVFQGSNDGNTWVSLDTQTDNPVFNSINQWGNFPINNSSAAYQYFRLYTTGNNSSNYYLLALGEMELYGSFVT